MSNPDVVKNKVSAVRKYRNILSRYELYSEKELQSDIDIRGAVERYLYLTVQSTIELAESFIALHKLRKPTTMRESFDILSEEGVVSAELTGRLVDMVGFRNIIAHDYGDIDYGIVYRVLHERVADIESFIEVIENEMSA